MKYLALLILLALILIPGLLFTEHYPGAATQALTAVHTAWDRFTDWRDERFKRAVDAEIERRFTVPPTSGLDGE